MRGWKASSFFISKSGGKWATQQPEIVYNDIFVRIEAKSLGGSEYFVIFSDDKSIFVWTYLLKYKGEVFKEICCGKPWYKIPMERGLRLYRLTIEWRGIHFKRVRQFSKKGRFTIFPKHLGRMKKLKEWIRHWWKLYELCCRIRSYLRNFGLKPYQQLHMFGTEAQQQLWKE